LDLQVSTRKCFDCNSNATALREYVQFSRKAIDKLIKRHYVNHGEANQQEQTN